MDDTVYVSAETDELLALHANNGSEKWRYYAPENADSSPTVKNGTVYVGMGDGAFGYWNGIHAVDAETGNREWFYETNVQPSGSPTIANGTVYIGIHRSELLALDAATGERKWNHSVQFAGTAMQSTTVADGVVFAGSDYNYWKEYDDTLYALATDHNGSSSGSRAKLGTLGHVGDRGGGENQPPAVTLERATVCAGTSEPVRFDASATTDPDGIPASYQWSIDGQPVDASGPILDYQFDDTGEHIVSVTVTDDDGDTERTSQVLSVTNLDSPGITTVPATPEVGNPASFSLCGTDGEEIRWEFGDGTSATGTTVSHTYDSAGSYTVTATNTTSGANVTESINVTAGTVEITGLDKEKRITPIARYPVNETYSPELLVNGTNISHVEFDILAGETTRDSTPGDGFTRTINFENLTGPTYLTVTAVGENGATATKAYFIPVYSVPPLQEFLEACEQIRSDQKCSGGTIEYKKNFEPTAINKLSEPLGDEKTIELSAGAKLNVLELKLVATGGLSFESPIPESLINKFGLPAQATFNASGSLSGGAQLEPAENHSFDVNEEPLKYKGQANVEAAVDAPTPASIPLLGGVEVRAEIQFGLGAEGKLRDKTVTGPFNHSLTKGFVRGSGAALPQIGAIACDARAGPEIESKLGYKPPENDIFGETAVNFRAELDCPIYGGDYKVTLVKREWPGSSGAPSRVVTDRTSNWETQSKHGTAPGFTGSGAPDNVSAVARVSDADVERALQLSAANVTAPNDVERLTSDTVADKGPALAGSNGDYTLLWARQDEAKNVSAGHDIFVATSGADGWSEPTHITDDEQFDTRPDVARTETGTVAVWARANRSFDSADIANASGPSTVLGAMEIALATETNGTWSEPTLLTNNSALDTAPSVATIGDRALLTWYRDADGDVTTSDDRHTAYAVYSNGSLSPIRTLDTETVATTPTPTGDLRLAYADGRSVVTGTVDAAGNLTSVERIHPAATQANVTAVATGPEQTAWIAGSGGNQTLQVTADSGVQTLETRPNVTGLTELALDSDGNVTLLTYRGRTPGHNGSTLYYRLERDGTWITDHGFTSGVGENLSVWDSSTALTESGFRSAYLAEPYVGFNSTESPRADIFTVRHTYRPDYSVDANVSTAAPGETVPVEYTLSNIGDSTATETATVELVNETGVVATATHDSLAAGETVTGTLNGQPDSSGELTVRVDSENRTAELSETNNNVTLVTGRPDLRVTSVTETRTNGTLTVTATVTNDGNATAKRPVYTISQDDSDLARTEADPIAPGTTRQLRATVDPNDVERGALTTVRVAADAERNTTRNARQVRVAQPDLQLSEHTVKYYDTAGNVRVEVLVGNAGTGSAAPTVEVRDGGDVLGSRTVSIPGSDTNTSRFRTVSLLVPESTAGDSVSIRASSRQLDANPTDNGIRTTVTPVLATPESATDDRIVVTKPASGSTATSATLVGSVQELGDAQGVNTGFMYWERGNRSTTAEWVTAEANRTTTGHFTADISALSPNTTYVGYAAAYAEATGWSNGTTDTFTTDDGGYSVETRQPTDGGGASATLVGNVSRIAGVEQIDLGFRYWVEGRRSATTERVDGTENRSTNGTFTATVSGLDTNETYVVQAVGRHPDAGSERGTTVTFTPDVAPDPDISVGTETPTATAPVEFSAATADDVTVSTYAWDFDGDGRTDATGETATYTYGDSGTKTVTLAVTDSAGVRSTRTRDVTIAAVGDDSGGGGSSGGGSVGGGSSGGGSVGGGSSGGGSVGGGSSGGAVGPAANNSSSTRGSDSVATEVVSTERGAEVMVSDARAGTPVTAVLANATNSTVGEMVRLSVTPASNESEFNVTVSAPSSTSSELPPVAQAATRAVFEANATGISNSEIRSVSVRVAIPLRASTNGTGGANLTLYRHTDAEWVALETTSLGGGMFEANATTLSTFAVGRPQSDGGANGTLKPEKRPKSTDDPVSETDTTVAEPTSTTGGSGPGFTVLLALASLLVGGLLAILRVGPARS